MADEGDSNVTIALGQTCHHGELGLGVGVIKSATKPTRVMALEDLDMYVPLILQSVDFDHAFYRLDLAAGQNTTYFIIRPPSEADSANASKSTVAAAIRPQQNTWDSGWGFASPAATNSNVETVKASSPPPSDAQVNANASPTVSKPSASSSSLSKREAWESLPRFPPVLDAGETCLLCNEEKADIDQLECDKVDLLHSCFYTFEK